MSTHVITSPRLDKSPGFQIFKSPALRSLSSANLLHFIDHPNDTVNDELDEHNILSDVREIIIVEETSVWITGLIYLVGTVAFWILSVQLMNGVMKKTDYHHPLLAAYLNGSCFIFLGIRPLYSEFLAYGRDMNLLNDHNRHENYSSMDAAEESMSLPEVRLSKSEIGKVAFTASLFYFLTCYFGSAALNYTSASNQTILATSSSVFSLILGVLCNIERFTLGKLASVCLSMLGIILITSNKASSISVVTLASKFSTELIGNLLAITGAFAYSAFMTLLKMKLGKQTDSDSDSLLYGLLGLSTLLCGIPILLFYHVLGWEVLEMPQKFYIFGMLLTSSFFNALSDYFASCASLITSPLSVSLSLCAAIPITMFIDSYCNDGLNLSIQYLVGVLFIFSAFIFTNITEEKETVQSAIDNAVEEAINHDESLSVYLSPRLKSTNSAPTSITDLSISHTLDSSTNDVVPKLIVTGGQNHKYFFREINNR